LLLGIKCGSLKVHVLESSDKSKHLIFKCVN